VKTTIKTLVLIKDVYHSDKKT